MSKKILNILRKKDIKSANTLITSNVKVADVNYPHLPRYFLDCSYLFRTLVKPKE